MTLSAVLPFQIEVYYEYSICMITGYVAEVSWLKNTKITRNCFPKRQDCAIGPIFQLPGVRRQIYNFWIQMHGLLSVVPKDLEFTQEVVDLGACSSRLIKLRSEIGQKIRFRLTAV